MFERVSKIYHEYPAKFWMVILVSFIEGIGSTMLFPFFSLYITQRFNVGMELAGIILGLFSAFGVLGGVLGGALTDKFGRRWLIIFGMVFGAFSTVSLGLVDKLSLLYPLAVVIGVLTSIGGPATDAMLADLLPEEQRAEGFGIRRVAGNMAWIIGPTVGGFVAGHSFLVLFILNAIISLIVAVLFYLLIPETHPTLAAGRSQESTLKSIVGYGQVLKDFAFMAFLATSILMGLVYQQMYNTMPVYLRDVHGFSTSAYGFMLTSSAITVVLLQFWISRTIKVHPPFLMMAIGSIFYAIGFGMLGFISAYAMFVLAIVVVTFGEMMIMPTSQALTANFASADMRGRYMAVFGLAWSVPATFGPGAAGWLLDNFNPNLLWYVGGGLCLVTAFSFYILHLRIGRQMRFAAQKKEEPVGETLETTV